MFGFLTNKKLIDNQPAEKSVDQNDVDLEIVETSEMMEDDFGRYYIIKYLDKEERRTYIQGNLYGKYRGFFEHEDTQCKYYNFEIYESQITKVIKLNEKPDYKKTKIFPKNKLPDLLSTRLQEGSDYYLLNVYDPQFTNQRKISQKLQQTDGKESFGVIEGEIFGYIKDEVDVEREKKIYVQEPDICKPTLEQTGKTETVDHCSRKEYWCSCKTKTYWGDWECKELEKSDVKTGRREIKDGKIRYEFFYKNSQKKYWGDWQPHTIYRNESYGCSGYLLLLFLILFCIKFIPIIIPLLIFILLFKFLKPLLNYVVPLLLIIFLFSFMFATVKSCANENNSHIPQIVKDEPSEKIIKDISQSSNNLKNPTKKDSTITIYRKWKDYKDKNYEGKYVLNITDIKNSQSVKSSLPRNNYAFFVSSLRKNDQKKLTSVYNMLNTIKKQKKLNDLQFAEMVVSFVQDIPYALVLDKSCNPDLYSESFIKNYLSSQNALCDPNQPMGINSPLEFLANLKGDCDTRSLLLYTIFNYYNYDVLLLTSNYYQHSIIAIDLPFKGIKFNYYNKKYTVWETTSFQPPGILPIEISNPNLWDVTLKSKLYE